jgi:hypothetical protein
MGYMFNLEDNVKVIDVVKEHNENFIGVKGVIRDVTVDSNNNTVYGIMLTEGNEIIDKDMLQDFLLYFLARELELA